MAETIISAAVIRRMPVYHRHLKRLAQNGAEYTSTKELAALTGVHDSQIRKDLALTGLRGIPKRGYNTVALVNAIETFLNWNDLNSAFLVGVGNLGQALLNYNGYQEHGLKIIAGFDTDDNIVGKIINGIKILPLNKLTNLARRMHVHIGVITVPANSAQSIANLMVESGIEGIWNFAPVNLNVAEGIIVENVDLYRGLGVLSRRLGEKQQQ